MDQDYLEILYVRNAIGDLNNLTHPNFQLSVTRCWKPELEMCDDVYHINQDTFRMPIPNPISPNLSLHTSYPPTHIQ